MNGICLPPLDLSARPAGTDGAGDCGGKDARLKTFELFVYHWFNHSRYRVGMRIYALVPIDHHLKKDIS
jgi:hypothetical protein